MNEQHGYTKEKADKLIKEHENRADQLEKQAREWENLSPLEALDKGVSQGAIDGLRREAERERQKADNLKKLKPF